MKKIQAKKVRFVNANTLIVAIDVGKTTPVGYCLCPDGTEVKPFEFTNNIGGFMSIGDCRHRYSPPIPLLRDYNYPSG